jgi:hypothetical protein
VSREESITHTKGKAMPAKKPNILILWGDDIGYWNISAYNLGQMGYRTPSIDRIAKEGAVFTDWYGSRAARPGARVSSPVNRASGRACSKSACPARRKGCRHVT